MPLSTWRVPPELNYVGLFLTLKCQLNCSYCINDPDQAGDRRHAFRGGRAALSPDEWVTALARLPVIPDLPITLQGGEPTTYWGARGLGTIVNALPHEFDLLTNLVLEPDEFAAAVGGRPARLRRSAPYPSIRVSFHREEMERLWGADAFATLVARCEALRDYGLRVSADKRESDVGIYVVAHPENAITDRMIAAAAGRVAFEPKEFLGVHDGKLHGTYLYPYSTDLIARGLHPETLTAECRTSELLLDPLGFVWPCHLYLYEAWTQGGPIAQAQALREHGFRFTERGRELFARATMRPIGHVLDPAFELDAIRAFRTCTSYGRCIGCDTKVKNDRFQSLDDAHVPHTSVEIRNLRLPPGLRAGLPDTPFLRNLVWQHAS
jgi:hypothetical protein